MRVDTFVGFNVNLRDGNGYSGRDSFGEVARVAGKRVNCALVVNVEVRVE
jgi:hypothetical protein